MSGLTSSSLTPTTPFGPCPHDHKQVDRELDNYAIALRQLASCVDRLDIPLTGKANVIVVDGILPDLVD